MKIAVTTETTVDLPKNLLAEYGIRTIPFTILLGETPALDGEITPEEIFAYVDKTGILPKTSAVNRFQFEEFFGSILKEYDCVIHISLSSKISSAYENASSVAKEMKNVFVIDSMSLSTGIATLAIYASKLVKKGLEPEEIVRKVTLRVPFVQASFVIQTVDYLYKGGRCTALEKFGVSLFHIKPQINVRDGGMLPGHKYLGNAFKAVSHYCADTLKEFNNPDLSLAFITHSRATPEMVEEARRQLKEKGFRTIYETTAGGTISSHCGPKCLGILYINDGKDE